MDPPEPVQNNDFSAIGSLENSQDSVSPALDQEKDKMAKAEVIQTMAVRTGKKSTKSKMSYLPKFERDTPSTPQLDSVKQKGHCEDWKDVRKSMMNVAEADQSSQETLRDVGNSDVLEADGSLKMFWFDAFEKNGKVFLFGKVILKIGRV